MPGKAICLQGYTGWDSIVAYPGTIESSRAKLSRGQQAEQLPLCSGGSIYDSLRLCCVVIDCVFPFCRNLLIFACRFKGGIRLVRFLGWSRWHG